MTQTTTANTSNQNKPFPSVSVVIPCRGSRAYLEQCLQALKNQEISPVEIIVSIDGSDEALEATVKAYGVKSYVSSVCQGPGIARNHGAALATGDILLFIDADIVSPADTVADLARFFAENPDIDAAFGSYDDTPSDKGFFSQYRNLLHHHVHQRSSSQAKTFWSGCGAIRRSVFEKLGGFSERYRKPSIEDIELGYRLSEAGYKIALCKSVQVQHLKVWNFTSICHTDIFLRSLPWSRLLINSKGRYINDLNMDWKSIASIAIFLILLPFSLFLEHDLLIVQAGLVLAWFWLNYEAIRFFARVRGMGFAAKVIPMLWVYYLCAGLGYLLAWGEKTLNWAASVFRRPVRSPESYRAK